MHHVDLPQRQLEVRVHTLSADQALLHLWTAQHTAHPHMQFTASHRDMIKVNNTFCLVTLSFDMANDADRSPDYTPTATPGLSIESHTRQRKHCCARQCNACTSVYNNRN